MPRLIVRAKIEGKPLSGHDFLRNMLIFQQFFAEYAFRLFTSAANYGNEKVYAV